MINKTKQQIKLQDFVKSFQKMITIVASIFVINGSIYSTIVASKYRFDTRILEMNSEMGLLLDGVAKELIVGDKEGANIVVSYIASRYLAEGESIFLHEDSNILSQCGRFEYALGRSRICWKPFNWEVQVTWLIPNIEHRYRIVMKTSLNNIGFVFFNFNNFSVLFVILGIYLIASWFLYNLNQNLIVPISKLHDILESKDFKFNLYSRFTEVQSLVGAVQSLSIREKKEIELAKYQTIAQMTQHLAHDVRKPFSMLKTGLNLLQASSQDAQRFKQNLTLLVSEVERATKSVDGLLTDVMEIGSNSTTLIQEPISPETLIDATLNDVFRVYPKSNIFISYHLSHTHKVSAHLKKVNRVFSNIVGNAIQAINYTGSIWFKTKMNGDFVQFCIGNSGSFIPEDSIKNIFDAFFTSGKKCGTGLGLAIAHKVVLEHGGKIWCESVKSQDFPEGKVEFFFDLPLANQLDFSVPTNLPRHSHEITKFLTVMNQTEKSTSDREFNRNEVLLHQEVLQRASTLSHPLTVLLIDDESIYRTALAGWIDESVELRKLCQIHQASDSTDALKAIKEHQIDLIITDIDMGPKSLNGFDLVKELRCDLKFNGLIFVHSNRVVPDDHHRASDLGANGFLPKPMAKGQLFKLLLHAIQVSSSRTSFSHRDYDSTTLD